MQYIAGSVSFTLPTTVRAYSVQQHTQRKTLKLWLAARVRRSLRAPTPYPYFPLSSTAAAQQEHEIMTDRSSLLAWAVRHAKLRVHAVMRRYCASAQFYYSM